MASPTPARDKIGHFRALHDIWGLAGPISTFRNRWRPLSRASCNGDPTSRDRSGVPSSICGQINSREVFAGIEQLLLPLRIAGGWVRATRSHVIKVPSRNRRGRVAADREPRLSAMRGVQVIRRSRTSHLGCHPARLESVGENFRPAACDREGQKHIVQLGSDKPAVPAMGGAPMRDPSGLHRRSGGGRNSG